MASRGVGGGASAAAVGADGRAVGSGAPGGTLSARSFPVPCVLAYEVRMTVDGGRPVIGSARCSTSITTSRISRAVWKRSSGFLQRARCTRSMTEHGRSGRSSSSGRGSSVATAMSTSPGFSESKGTSPAKPS
ncbi:MAG: hypothetical protein M5U28_26425 [Sandaracinaceae bacterium]|nr:hypothetical protein [Sandaracinaceae bacterium]